MAEALHTIVCEFRGGTYVSQVHATDVDRALKAWAVRLKLEKPIPRASARLADAILAEGAPVPLEGLQGVWCATATLGRSLALLNIVRSA